jgi:hypothetical protein
MNNRKSDGIAVTNKEYALLIEPTANEFGLKQHVGQFHVDLVEEPERLRAIDDDIR